MRQDAIIDKRQVYCPNASTIGYSTQTARHGYFVVWNDCGQHKLCRVLGRVAYAPTIGSKENNTFSPAIRNHLLVTVLNQSTSSQYIRWIAPEEVEECYSPEDYAERMKGVFSYFMGDEIVRGKPADVAGEIMEGYCSGRNPIAEFAAPAAHSSV